MRTEENFQIMIVELDKLNKQYEKGQLKYHQKTDKTDRVFEQYGWQRTEFFKELNARLGIQAHSTKPAKKTLKKKQAVSSLPPLNDVEKRLIGNDEKISAIREYRNRTGASLYGAKVLCEQYANSLLNLNF